VLVECVGKRGRQRAGKIAVRGVAMRVEPSMAICIHQIRNEMLHLNGCCVYQESCLPLFHA